MKNQATWRTALLLAVATLALACVGCVRMPVLPTADADTTHFMSEPRPVDHLVVPLEKDPTQIYRVGARDVLWIDARKDPALSQDYTVTEEGHILIANIGAVEVADLTTEEIQQKINEILTQYIREPDAKVGVRDYQSKKVYVVGQVANPGPQIMRADMLTLQEAVFGAGLITANAAPRRTNVITPNPDDPNNPVVRQIDLADIIYKGKMAENILLQPNDIVYVPARYAINVTGAIRELLAPIEEVYNIQYRAQFGDTGRR